MLLDALSNRSRISIISLCWDKAADMFLAACSKSWFSCAKGHIHRLRASTAATCHSGCNYRRPANLQLKNTNAEVRWLQRLKTRCWTSSHLACDSYGPDLDLHREAIQRADPPTSVICRSKLHKLHLPVSSSSFSLYGSNGFCTDASRKPVWEEKCSKQDSREKEEVQGQGTSSPPADEGHFQFKELVSQIWLLHSHFHTGFLNCFSSQEIMTGVFSLRSGNLQQNSEKSNK